MRIMKYMVQSGNWLFDILYSHGIFLPPDAALKAGKATLNLCAPCLLFL